MKLSLAWSILGVEPDSNIVDCRSAYKKKILQLHPDKNNAPTATEDTAQLTTAWQLVKRYHTHKLKPKSKSRRSSTFFTNLFGSSGDDSDGNSTVADDEDEEEGDDEEQDFETEGFEYFGSADDFADDIDFFQLYEILRRHAMQQAFASRRKQSDTYASFLSPQMSRSSTSGSNMSNARKLRNVEQKPKETYEEMLQRKERLRQKEAAAKAAEKALRDEHQREEKEKANKNRAEKKEKRALAQKEALAAQQLKAEERLRKVQQKRSMTFAAARYGNFAQVKAAIYEEDVVAAGKEFENAEQARSAGVPFSDDTLLHIVARAGDISLCEWLMNNGADHSERDASKLTAFHWSLKQGHTELAKLFIDLHSPSEDFNFKSCRPPRGTTFLELAMSSVSPSTVKLVLDRGLAKIPEMHRVWTQVLSERQRKHASAGWKDVIASFKADKAFKPAKNSGDYAKDKGPTTAVKSADSDDAQDVITTLTDLGFPREAVLMALKRTSGNVEAAASYLLDETTAKPSTAHLGSSSRRPQTPDQSPQSPDSPVDSPIIAHLNFDASGTPSARSRAGSPFRSLFGEGSIHPRRGSTPDFTVPQQLREAASVESLLKIAQQALKPNRGSTKSAHSPVIMSPSADESTLHSFPIKLSPSPLVTEGLYKAASHPMPPRAASSESLRLHSLKYASETNVFQENTQDRQYKVKIAETPVPRPLSPLLDVSNQTSAVKLSPSGHTLLDTPAIDDFMPDAFAQTMPDFDPAHLHESQTETSFVEDEHVQTLGEPINTEEPDQGASRRKFKRRSRKHKDPVDLQS